MIYSKETPFHRTPLLKEAIFEIFLNLLHPNPYLQGKMAGNLEYTFRVYNSSVGFYVNYSFNDILCIIGIVVKCYYMLKQVFLSLEYNSNKMQRLV